MTVNISKMYGMDIYSAEAGYVGKVHDIILDMEAGLVVRLTTEPLKMIGREEAKKVFQNQSVLFSNVISVKDIVIVQKKAATYDAPESEPEKLKRSTRTGTKMYTKSPGSLIRRR